ncbi:PLP-dependent cysteine synthase family protein [Benzoatithermus flavus]|uniref:L-cysteine desulfhydrase Cds1 n=1 Tax=Benzoatithermus flavus TaxID=3108223 RepID=A0ABU8XKK1_9PROT
MDGRIVDRAWVHEAIARIEADITRSADTHLIRLELPACPGIDLYLKDESTHPSGSLKHRLARSLFLYGLCNGWIGPKTTIVEASSGSTAVSEAYFAKLLGLPFVAVMPRSTSQEKVAQIEFQGGRCHFVDHPAEVYETSRRLAAEAGGHYMDQFTFAERATDWRGNNNIAESIFAQMRLEPAPVPRWIVCGAGTGGTSATIGRYIRYRRLPTKLCVVDPERSVFHRYFADRSVAVLDGPGSCIEGIGRPRVEPSFIPEIVDRMIAVSDAASIAAMRVLSERLGRRCGGSTGTNLWGCAVLISEMVQVGETGSIVTLLCDPGERYLASCFDDGWLRAKSLDIAADRERLERFFVEGRLAPVQGAL